MGNPENSLGLSYVLVCSWQRDGAQISAAYSCCWALGLSVNLCPALICAELAKSVCKSSPNLYLHIVVM